MSESNILSNIKNFFHLPFEDPIMVFLLVLLIILFSPLLFRKIKLHYIIGLILAGVLVGPHGFNLLAYDRSFELLGKVGVLYIMFLAGLELDIKEFNANKGKSLLFGVFTFLLPFVFGFPICHYLLGYSVPTSLLVAGMFSTHTLISYPIVSNLNLSKNQAVTASVGGTIFTDTAVLLILAVVMNQAKNATESMFWLWMGISITLFLIFIFFFIPILSKWFFERFENEKRLHYIYVLSIMLLSAFVSELCGLEGIIGSFFAGLILNRFIPHSSALMNRIEFIGNSLFIPIFLISVGMLVNIKVIFSGYQSIVIALVLSVVAIGSKWLAAWITQVCLRFTKNQRNLIFGLTSSHAAATLAVIMSGYSIGIIDENILNATIVIILLSCIVSSVVTQKAGERVQKDELENKPKEDLQQKRILIALANPKSVQNLIETALLMTRSSKKEPLYALNIIDDQDASVSQVRKGQQLLEEAEKIAAASDNRLRTITRYDTDVASGILHTAKENQVTDVILGISNQAAGSVFLEKINEKIQKDSELNIFVLKNNHPINTQKRVLVAIPENAEKEIGFLPTLYRICKLVNQLEAKIIFHASSSTIDFLKTTIKKNKMSVSADFRELAQWEDFLMLRKYLKEKDLLVIYQTRKGAVSYHMLFEKIPYYLKKFFDNSGVILVYPKQKETDLSSQNLLHL
ncbi:MAG: cation:proton antiporter [Paludibacteraceae bacterium]|nr:cation:proton antiporter [Paludibacteraceae bacterium]